MDFEESLKTVKPFQARRDFSDYVPRAGMSLKFILKHLSDIPGVESMYDLEAYVLKLTQRHHCSVTELLAQHSSYQSSVVDTASYFVSFAYSTSYATMLDALDKFMRKTDAEDIFVWISIFSINQHFGRGEQENAPVEYPKGWFKDAFEQIIPAIRNVLFVMSPLRQPVALQRLWCIYELYLTVLYPGCTLDVCLSEEDELFFMQNLVKDTQTILEYIDKVNAQQARSSNPKQEEKLRRRIEQMDGQYETINSKVRDKLRLWFAQVAKLFIKTNKQTYQKDKAQYIELIRMVGKLFGELGRFEEAESLKLEDLYESVGFYGNEHFETATAMNNLAELLVDQGKYEEALAMHEDALAIRRKTLKSDNPYIAQSLNNLASLLSRVTSDYARAEKLQREALMININALGDEHPVVASELSNLGNLLLNQGKLEEAEAYVIQAIDLAKKISGEEHVSVAGLLNNLGMIKDEQGHFEEAKRLYEKAIALWKKSLGADHPSITTGLINLAGVYSTQRRYDKAIPLQREAVRIQRQSGGNKESLAHNLRELARMLKLQGEIDESAVIYQEALHTYKQVGGDEHIKVAMCLVDLGKLYEEMGDLEPARLHFEEALAILRIVRGNESQEVGACLTYVGRVLFRMGKLEEAEQLSKESLDIMRALYGNAHPYTKGGLDNVRAVLRARGKHDEAAAL